MAPAHRDVNGIFESEIKFRLRGDFDLLAFGGDLDGGAGARARDRPDCRSLTVPENAAQQSSQHCASAYGFGRPRPARAPVLLVVAAFGCIGDAVKRYVDKFKLQLGLALDVPRGLGIDQAYASVDAAGSHHTVTHDDG